MRGIVNKAYGSRPYRSGDEAALVDLYSAVSGRSRTSEEYRWEWLQTPEGQGSMWVIENKDTGEVIGHHGLIPIPLSYFGERMLMGKTENTMIHPQYRGKVLYFLYEKEFVEEAKERFDLLYTTQGSGTPGRIRKRLGYISVGPYERLFSVSGKTGLDQLAAEIISRTIRSELLAWLANRFFVMFNHVLVPFLTSNISIDRKVRLRRIDDIEEVKEGLDELWERSKPHFGITVDRNASYLKWRIFDNPNLSYDFFVAERESEVVGYAVMEYTQTGNARIVDVVADSNDGILLNTVFQGLRQRLHENDFRVIELLTLKGHNSLNRAARRNGFISFSVIDIVRRVLRKGAAQERSHLLVKVFSGDLAYAKVGDPNSWYYTSIFMEGLKAYDAD